jgi:hypothetical protein
MKLEAVSGQMPRRSAVGRADPGVVDENVQSISVLSDRVRKAAHVVE